MEEGIISYFKIILTIVFLFICASTNAQTFSKIDTTSSLNSSLSDTSKFVMKKSAWGAVLRSAVLPGFGQFYNQSYWKIPLFWGAFGYLGYIWNNNNNNYKLYRDLYNNSLPNREVEEYYKRREFYRDQRDLFAVFIGLTYFLNLVDAYVDAHLFDFDVETENTINNYQLSIKVRF